MNTRWLGRWSGGVAMAAVLTLAGCVSPQRDPRLTHKEMPIDFAVHVYVEGDPAVTDPLRQTSQYILQPDRLLRVAVGPGVTAGYFPRATRALTPAEMEALWGHVRESGLMHEPTTAPATQPSESGIRYHVEITAHQQVHEFVTRPEESTATVELLMQLAKLRGAAVATTQTTTSPAPAAQEGNP